MFDTGPVLFISDAHLGRYIEGCDDREKHLLTFLNTVALSSTAVFIVGDLFDFWIEYRFAIRPDYFKVLYQLKKLVDHGVEVHYLAGNHDFALGPFIEDVIGLKIHLDHFETTVQGKRLHLFHGDGLIRADVGYRLLRKVLRNPFNQKLFKLIHPDIGIPLGAVCSGSSRKMTARWMNENVLAEYRQRAKEYMEQGNDIVVFGHTHRPEISTWGEKVFCNSGEWIERYTFAKLENGNMSLWEYFPNKPPQRLAESSLINGNNKS